MADTQTIRELAELAIVAAASVFVCLAFVWGKRTSWEVEMTALRSSYERQREDAAEAHRVELRELDAFNASERRRLENEIETLKAQIVALQTQRNSDWQMLREVLASRGITVPSAPPSVALNITSQGDMSIGGPVTGRDSR